MIIDARTLLSEPRISRVIIELLDCEKSKKELVSAYYGKKIDTNLHRSLGGKFNQIPFKQLVSLNLVTEKKGKKKERRRKGKGRKPKPQEDQRCRVTELKLLELLSVWRKYIVSQWGINLSTEGWKQLTDIIQKHRYTIFSKERMSKLFSYASYDPNQPETWAEQTTFGYINSCLAYALIGTKTIPLGKPGRTRENTGTTLEKQLKMLIKQAACELVSKKVSREKFLEKYEKNEQQLFDEYYKNISSLEEKSKHELNHLHTFFNLLSRGAYGEIDFRGRKENINYNILGKGVMILVPVKTAREELKKYDAEAKALNDKYTIEKNGIKLVDGDKMQKDMGWIPSEWYSKIKCYVDPTNVIDLYPAFKEMIELFK